jgi:hypothetical protein
MKCIKEILFKVIYSQGFLIENTWFMVREDEVHKRDPKHPTFGQNK